MKYNELIQAARESTNENAAHTKQQLYVLFFRMLGFYVAPLFLKLNVSANKVSLLGLLIGLIASGLILSGNVFSGIVAYFFAVLLDHVDGTIARVNNVATFFGRFIDGFIGIILVTVIRLSLSVLLTKTYGLNLIVWLGIISTIFSPMHYLFYDRYSAFSRWINEEHPNENIKPYLRGSMPLYYNKINDLQNILLLCLPLYFYFTNFYEYFLLIYFLLNIYMAIHTFYIYTLSAYKNFIIPAKPHR